MAITLNELDEFHSYARSQLDRPQPPESIQECLTQWRRECEEADVVRDIQTASREIEAGAGVSLEQAEQQLRGELSWFGPAR